MDEQKSVQKPTKASIYITIAVCVAALGLGIWSATMNPATKSAELQTTTAQTQEQSLKAVEEKVTGVTQSPATATTATRAKVTTTTKTTKSAVAKYFVMPVEGVSEVIKKYSAIQLQYSNTFGDWRIHTAVDIKGKEGCRVNSAGNGKITGVFDDKIWGKIVEIDHGNGVIARYCGLSDYVVEKGDTVAAGEKIGTIGTPPCELKDGVHLHFEAKQNDKTVDPLTLMKSE